MSHPSPLSLPKEPLEHQYADMSFLDLTSRPFATSSSLTSFNDKAGSDAEQLQRASSAIDLH
jgi:hypothetical protein